MDKNKDNWMRAEVEKALLKKGIVDENLVDELTIKQIEYGRNCILSVVARFKDERESEKYAVELDKALCEKIYQLDGTPKVNYYGRKKLG